MPANLRKMILSANDSACPCTAYSNPEERSKEEKKKEAKKKRREKKRKGEERESSMKSLVGMVVVMTFMRVC